MRGGSISEETLPGDSGLSASRTRAGGGTSGSRVAAREGESVLGTTWGRYEIVRRIGRGAFGAVFEARDPQLGRSVALKILHGFESGSGLQQQLLREAQAMAAVSHPNVVTVHDVGVHRGQAFVAMELVDGWPLGAWVEQEPRTWRAIVDVFRQAGRGLAAAHAEGLVHRDFKPDNVLVGRDGRVRVTDFGLARPLVELSAEVASTDAADSKGTTRGGMGPGTPAYMAPELFSGNPADETTDQYAFCISLFEALHGRRPSKAASLQGVVAERLWAPTLDIRVSDRGEPRWLRKLIARGVSAEPSRRWPSMQQLVEALDGPRRRRWLLGAAGMGLAAAVVFSWPGGEPETTCQQAETVLEQVWSTDRREAVAHRLAAVDPGLSTKVTRGLGEHVQVWAEAYAKACRMPTGDEQSRRRRDDQLLCLRGQVDTFSAFMEVLGDGTERELVGASDAMASLPDPDDCLRDPAAQPIPDEVRAALDRSRVLQDLSRDVEARAVLDEIAVAEGSLAALEVALRRNALHDRFSTREASREQLESIYLEASELGFDRQAADAAIRLARIRGAETYHPEEAEQWLRRADSLLQRLPPDPGLTFDRDETRANILRRRRDFREALTAFDALEEEGLGQFGPDHWRTIRLRINYGGALMEAGELPASADLLRSTLADARSSLGEHHRLTLECQVALARTLHMMGEADESREILLAARRSYERFFGEEGALAGIVESALASIAWKEGDLGEAQDRWQRALAAFEAQYGPQSLELISTLVKLGDLEWQRGQAEEGTRLYRRAFDIAIAQGGESGPDAPRILINLFAHQAKARMLDEAASTLEQARPLIEKQDLRTQSTFLLNEALFSLELGKEDAAVAKLERVVSLGDRAHPGAVAQASLRLATFLWDREPAQRPRLAALAREALALARRTGLELTPYQSFVDEKGL